MASILGYVVVLLLSLVGVNAQFPTEGQNVTIIKNGSVLPYLPPNISSNESAQCPYKNPALSTDERVADLLSRMSIADKTAQLMQGQ